MKTKVLASIASLLALVCVVFAAMPGRADEISDILRVFNPNGTISQNLTARESQEDNGGNFFAIGVEGLADPAAFGNPTTLCEPDTSPCNATTPFTSLSDIVGVVEDTIGGHTFFVLAFTSDGENGITPGIQAIYGGFGSSFIVEQANTNQIIDVTYLLAPNLRTAGLTATFQSEFVVPEPSTVVLLGTGLLGMAELARRRMSR